jgi:RHS repeat-associated protein
VGVSLDTDGTGSGGTCISTGTAADGTCVINSVNPDDQLIPILTKSGYFTKTVTLTPTPLSQRTLTIWPSSTTQTIRVVSGATGLPVQGVDVDLDEDSTGSGGTCISTGTAADGTCVVNAVNPDDQLIPILTLTNYFTKTLTLTPTPGAQLTLTIWPTSTTQSIKVVSGATGSAVASVGLALPSGCPNGSFTTSPSCTTTGTTDGSGVATIQKVNPDASVQLTLTLTNYFTKTLTLTPTPGAQLTLTIWPTSTTQSIKVVSGATGLPVQGVAFTLNEDSTGSGGTCLSSGTAADGTCVINAVNPDELIIATLSKSGYFTTTISIHPASGTFVVSLSGSSSLEDRNEAVAVNSSLQYFGDSSTTLPVGGVSPVARTYLTFAPPALPDGGQVYRATLGLYKASSGSQAVTISPTTAAWDPAAIGWTMQPSIGSAIATITPPSGTGALTVDVTSWAKSAYTRNFQSSRPQWGFSLRSTLDGQSGSGSWNLTGNGGTTFSQRPTLTIEYRVVSGTIAFAPALGPNFQPSLMLTGKPTTLPLVVTNTSWYTWPTTGEGSVSIGYRWLDADGKLLALAGFAPTGSVALSADLAPDTSVNIDLPVLAPSVPVQARLRIDAATSVGGAPLYFSDSAEPAKYNAPAKASDADSGTAAYVGTSVVKRSEFAVEVTDDANVQSIGTSLAEGGRVAIDAFSGNLALGAIDLAVPERGSTLAIGRSYNSALAGVCDGMLAACGWFTTADERITAGLTGSPVYTDSQGHRHAGLVDHVGQVGFAGSVGGDLTRRRVTLLDEVRRTGWTGTTPTIVTSPVATGTNAQQIADNSSASLGGLAIRLNTFPTVAWQQRTTTANSSAVIFTVVDSVGRTDTIAYVHGTTFPTNATVVINDTTGSTVGAFVSTTHNVYADALAGDASLGQQLTLTAITLVAPSGAGATTFDGMFAIPNTSVLLADSWSGTGGSLQSTDVFAGSQALSVSSTATKTVTGTGLAANPFLTWAWKKGAGSSVAIVVTVTDVTTNATHTLGYYAGSSAGISAEALIPVSGGLPVGWTQVTRNVLDDARQSFQGMADPTQSRAGIEATKTAPQGNFFQITSVVLGAVDGTTSLFDAISLGSAPSVATGDTTHEWALDDGKGNLTFFNEGGRISQTADASGNARNFGWTYTPATDSWRLSSIAQAYDANRALTFGYPSAGVTTITDVQGRVVTYTVTGTDLTSVQSFRGGTTTYGYDAAHRLTSVKDPRYAVGNDYQVTIAYDGAGLATTIYQGAVAANVPIAKVLNKTSVLVAGLTGIQLQNAQHLAANTSQVIEVDPNASIVNEYAPKSGTTLPSSADLRIAHEHDGLAQATRITRYRTSGQANPLVERTGSNAEAALNNFKQPPTTARVMWTQTPAEYAASTDPTKLQYRTITAYDANNNVVSRTDALGHTVYSRYDSARRPIYVDDNFVANGAFASDLAGWTTAGGSPAWSNTAGSGTGFFNGGVSLGAGAATTQAVTLAAGQTFHLQADGKNGVTVVVKYHTTSGWTSLGTLGPIGSSSYAASAATYSIPLDTDNGQVQLTLTGATNGAIDNVLLRTVAVSTTYDTYGNPTTTTDLLGRVRHAYYDADPSGNHAAGVYQTKIVANEIGGGSNADQNVTTLVSRNKLGNELTTTDPIGRVTTTVHAANGVDATSLTDPAGNQTTFSYDVGGRILTKVAPNGNVTGGTPSQHTTTNTYDGMGRLVDVADALGKVSHSTYNAAGLVIESFENYTGGGSPLSGLTNVKSTTTYNGDGVPITTVMDAGAGNLALTTTFTYDQQNNRVTVTDPAGRVTTTYYDSAGRAAGVRLPIAPTGAPAPLCPSEATLRCNELTAFDVLSRPVTSTDALGNVTTTTFDLSNEPVSVTNARGYTTSTRYDVAGRQVSLTGATGSVSTTIYDALDRPTIQTAPDSTLFKVVYDKAGQVIDASDPAAAGTPDGSLNWTHSTYDPAGRVLTVTAHYVSGGSATADQNVVVATNTYDANGNTLTTTDAPGTVGGSGIVTKATFDALNRTTQVITNYVSGGPTDNQTNLTTSYGYDSLGHRITETDPAGVVTRSEYDRAHRLTAVVGNYINGQPVTASQNVRSTYGYNANGELINYCPPVLVAAGNCLTAFWAYGRDGFGNVSSQSAPTGSSLASIAATYDAAGRLASSSDGLHAQSYTYDATHNVTQIQASGGGAATITYSYAYDALDRRTSASNGSDTLTFEYDTLDRLTATKRSGVTIDGATYNPNGTIATSTQPAGTATFTYDGLSRLASAAMPALFSGTATFTWRPDSLLGSRSWPAGTNETFTYDAAKRPSQLQLKTGGGTTLATISTTFDRVGNLTSESQVIPGQAGLAGNSTLTFTNDPLRRVTGYSVNGGAATTYTYDADSNRLSAGTTTFTYNTADQLLTQTKSGVTRTFGYDAAGNQTSSPVSPTTNSTFTYDALNKPLTVTVPGQSAVTYAYDALGRRRTRTAAGTTETYGYVGELIARIDRGGGSITDSAIDAMGDRLTVGGAWTIPNVRGDVAGLLNAAQTAVSDAYRYDPYGVNLDTQGSTSNPYRFQGRLLESTSGQYDFGARQYDPAIATFTGLDTVMGAAQNPLSLNRYLYVQANPEVMIDRDGHRAEQFNSTAERDSAVRNAKAALAAARRHMDAASSALNRAIAAVNAARSSLNARCPVVPCPIAFQKDWKQSKLDAYAMAASARAAAKARYDAASQAVRDAERHLRAVQATGSWKPTRQPAPEPTRGRGTNTRSTSSANSGDEDGIGGFLHGALDVIGMVPLIGEPADLLNAGIYAAEGDIVNAGLSAASAIPLAGNVIGAGKLALKYGDDVVGFAASHVDEAASIGAKQADEVTSCAVKSLNSFSPDTAVTTPEGAVAISDIEVGDEVETVDPNTGAVGDYRVTAVHVNEDPAIAYLRIDGETIETTPDHRFLTDEGWVEAEQLEPGDQVRNLDGSFGTVHGYRIEFRPIVMWDLTVSAVHTFAVGGGEWVVHNDGCPIRPFGSGKGPHEASYSVTDPSGGVVSQGSVRSGGMTPDEAALGFPQNTLATHTERRALTQVDLAPGQTMNITGTLRPCPTCRGAMNASAQRTGADIIYTWPGGVWRARR